MQKEINSAGQIGATKQQYGFFFYLATISRQNQFDFFFLYNLVIKTVHIGIKLTKCVHIDRCTLIVENNCFTKRTVYMKRTVG